MWKFVVAFALAALAASGQTAPATGSISGTVVDSRTGAPVPQLPVMTSGSASAKSDAQGRYTLSNVPPGRHTLYAGFPVGRDPVYGQRVITLAEGQNLDSIDIRVELKGTISGKVVDENKEPVPGLEIDLIAPEYRLGSLLYYRRYLVRTDDKGEYRLQGVPPGMAFLILARTANRSIPPISDAPADPKSRKKVAVPTYYPNAPSPESAMPILLRAGEHREGIDIVQLRAPSYCLEGRFDLDGRAAEVAFQIHELQPSFGISTIGGVAGLAPAGKTGPDGRVRICDLHPGEYRMSVYSGDVNEPDSLGSTVVTIADRDVAKVGVNALPRMQIAGQFVWAGQPPEKAFESQAFISLRALHRSIGSTGRMARVLIPGEFLLKDILTDEHEPRAGGLSGSLYVKDITYGGASIIHRPVRPGSAMAGAELRVVVGHDGGRLEVKVADKDGNPVSGSYVIVMPKDVYSEPDLAAKRIVGETDQNGTYSSPALAPGVYQVLATTLQVAEAAPDAIGKLWRARSKAKEIDVGPNATVKLTLEPVKIE